MNKSDIVTKIIANHNQPPKDQATAYAPTNIALCKYWGKRNPELNLPITSSLSISLADKGATTTLSISNTSTDIIILNSQSIPTSTPFGKRLTAFLDLFRTHHKFHFHINIQVNIPLAAGLASSACGFASLVLALDKLLNWQLPKEHLSILARLGSGSASRSIWQGFVEWEQGTLEDGMDSHGIQLPQTWPELNLGLLLINKSEKKISSREAMQRTIDTSNLYSLWPDKVNQDLIKTKQAIKEKDFTLLGKTAESNALTMHAIMLSAWPPISYLLPETVSVMHKIWDLREQGVELYFTQDAGPNLKLLFLSSSLELVKSHFPTMECINPFGMKEC